ncbi:MAG: DUF418 domain-containing protein [Verrucomicrobiales bacterium]|nr:DUF418 domain-containing protein [Verrucomicrobiales bacterium]
MPEPCPIGNRERITALDALRGFALLGILLMNVVGFGLYYQAYDNPTSAGGATGINLWIWFVLHVLAEGKMRCLFSLVFGASVILLTTRWDHRLDGADLYYRRTLWLMVMGIVHSFLLWQGEILFPYALCGLALYPFRKMAPRGLILLAAAMMVYCAGFYVMEGVWKRESIEAGKAASAKAQASESLTEEEREALHEWESMVKNRNPSPEALAEDAAEWHGNVFQVIRARGAVVLEWVSIPFYHAWNLDVLSMMLVGMAFTKLGIVTGFRSSGFYLRMALAGYLIGLPVNIYGGWIVVRSQFDPVIQSYSGGLYDLGRFSVACGHLGAILFLGQKPVFRPLMERLGAVGQMALTNYVMHSVVCAFLFTGYGFSLYGRLERYQLYYVVLALWAFQLVASPIWLKHFRFGPMEWCWRSLTYWRRQPMRWAPSEVGVRS